MLDVITSGDRLVRLRGIGDASAKQLQGAAQTLWKTILDETPLKIDVSARGPAATELLRALSAWESVRDLRAASRDLEAAWRLAPLARGFDRHVSHVAVFDAGRRPQSELRSDVELVVARARQLRAHLQAGNRVDPWADFIARPAAYYALLSDLGLLAEDDQKSLGDLPKHILEAIRKFKLSDKLLIGSLRGYQSFGARFALVQKKVVIGDEMGLGKTFEALAVLAHLHAKGERHAVVVCPAAVVANWMREVSEKSKLTPHRLHGPGRQLAADEWSADGGVAVTTYETLGWCRDQFLAVPKLYCVVVDEAHYVKNPDANRSRRVAELITLADRAVLLTGTPMENRTEEFRNLISYLRPDLTVDAGELSPARFRKQVAPAYLRRNQEDVLKELPPLIEVDEWVPMTPEDLALYRRAVGESNFMAMRQAAAAAGHQSGKMKRLVELVNEARENGRKVLVFSYFRAVLESAVELLPGQVFGPITGSVPAPKRQALVDDFSAAQGSAVLVAQIVAGGVGLNIQEASVVIICEPQLKPTVEWQAIARAHRMGQLSSVQVHRLLSDQGVDVRVTEILARKGALFDEFARPSDTAASAPEAVDVSEAQLAREVIAAERERLFPAAPGSQGPASDTLNG